MWNSPVEQNLFLRSKEDSSTVLGTCTLPYSTSIGSKMSSYTFIQLYVCEVYFWQKAILQTEFRSIIMHCITPDKVLQSISSPTRIIVLPHWQSIAKYFFSDKAFLFCLHPRALPSSSIGDDIGHNIGDDDEMIKWRWWWHSLIFEWEYLFTIEYDTENK